MQKDDASVLDQALPNMISVFTFKSWHRREAESIEEFDKFALTIEQNIDVKTILSYGSFFLNCYKQKAN